MSKWTVIFASVCVLAIAIIVSSFAPAISQSRNSSYMVANGGGQFVWRVNVGDGSVSYCVRTATTTNAAQISRDKVTCSAGSDPATH